MARDLDFYPRRKSNKPIVNAAAPVQSGATAEKVTGSKAIWLWIIIILLATVAVWALWQSVRPISSSNSTPKITTLSSETSQPLSLATATSQPNNDSNLLLSPISAPNVQIYDSGAGATAVGVAVEKLKTLGYKVENLEKSQFNYDRTYIRYREGMQAEAEKIQANMPERLVSLKEVKSAGLFDILILYGVK